MHLALLFCPRTGLSSNGHLLFLLVCGIGIDWLTKPANLALTASSMDELVGRNVLAHLVAIEAPCGTASSPAPRSMFTWKSQTGTVRHILDQGARQAPNPLTCILNQRIAR